MAMKKAAKAKAKPAAKPAKKAPAKKAAARKSSSTRAAAKTTPRASGGSFETFSGKFTVRLPQIGRAHV